MSLTVGRLAERVGVRPDTVRYSGRGEPAASQDLDTPGPRAPEPLIDDHSRREFLRRIQQLRDELQDGEGEVNLERAAKAGEEMEFIEGGLRPPMGSAGAHGPLPIPSSAPGRRSRAGSRRASTRSSANIARSATTSATRLRRERSARIRRSRRRPGRREDTRHTGKTETGRDGSKEEAKDGPSI